MLKNDITDISRRTSKGKLEDPKKCYVTSNKAYNNKFVIQMLITSNVLPNISILKSM